MIGKQNIDIGDSGLREQLSGHLVTFWVSLSRQLYKITLVSNNLWDNATVNKLFKMIEVSHITLGTQSQVQYSVVIAERNIEV
jgi:hypothetical protein